MHGDVTFTIIHPTTNPCAPESNFQKSLSH